MKRLLIPLVILLLCSLVVIGCSSSTSPAPASTTPVPATTSTTPALTKTTSVPPPVTTPLSNPSSTSSSPAASNQTTAGAQSGGILKIISQTSAVNIGSPWAYGGLWDGMIRQPGVDTLIHFDNTGALIPWLATSWQVSPDAKSVIIKLKQGVKFQDGTDFNADAVKYNLDLCKQSSMVSGMIGLNNVTSIDVVDPFTIRYNLSQYDSSVIYGLGSTTIVSPTAAQKNGSDWCQTNPVGTGPFKFASFQKDVSLKYTKFDGYWQSGKPYLNGIEYSFVADPVTALQAYKAGQAQYLLSPSPKDALDLQKSGKIVDQAHSYVFGLVGDSANPTSPFANLKVRQAVTYAIDSASITKNLGYGFWQPTNQIYTQDSPAYNPDIKGYSYNPQQAKDLLTQAGYPNGFQTKLIVQTTTSKDMAGAIQDDLRSVGINADFQTIEPSVYTTTFSKGWQNALIVVAQPDSLAMDPGMSMRWFSKGSGRFGSVSVPSDFDAKLNQAQASIDNQSRWPIILGRRKTSLTTTVW